MPPSGAHVNCASVCRTGAQAHAITPEWDKWETHRFCDDPNRSVAWPRGGPRPQVAGAAA